MGVLCFNSSYCCIIFHIVSVTILLRCQLDKLQCEIQYNIHIIQYNTVRYASIGWEDIINYIYNDCSGGLCFFIQKQFLPVAENNRFWVHTEILDLWDALSVVAFHFKRLFRRMTLATWYPTPEYTVNVLLKGKHIKVVMPTAVLSQTR